MSEKENKLTYKDAGVDTKEGERAVKLMKDHVKKTFDANVLTGLGSFGSLYKLDSDNMKEPVLVAGTDGVGTKLKIAFLMDKHDTVGQDCVAMCVNDVLCQGAKPLFFLDYIATGKVTAEKVADIVKGVADGCALGGCALVGGETAEMPGFYSDGEYDMAGFSVGVVDKSRIIDGSKIKEGNLLIGISSSGIHSNGYSLVRKICFDKMGMKVEDTVPELGETLGEALLRPTKIYTRICDSVLRDAGADVKGMIHVTGGGFYENIPRIIPDGLGVKIHKGSWAVPKIFDFLQKNSGASDTDMFSTFNMGIGLIMIIDENDKEDVTAAVKKAGDEAFVIGSIQKGEGVDIC